MLATCSPTSRWVGLLGQRQSHGQLQETLGYVPGSAVTSGWLDVGAGIHGTNNCGYIYIYKYIYIYIYIYK